MATDRAAIVSELYRRRDTLPPDKQRVVDELARRFQITTPPAVLDSEQAPAAQPPGEPSILSQVGGAVRAGAMNPVAQTITEATGQQYVSLPERIEAGFRGKGGVRDIVQSGVRMLPKGVSDAIEQNPILQFAGDVVEEGAKGVGGLVEFMTSPLGVALPAVHRGLKAAQAAEQLAGVTGQAGAARTAQAARAAEAAIGGAFGASMAPHTAEAVGQAIDDPSGRNIAAAGVAAGMNVLPAAGGRAVNQRAKAMEARNAAAETSRQVRAENTETAMRDPVAAMGTREVAAGERAVPIPERARPVVPGPPGPKMSRAERRATVEPPTTPGPTQAEQMKAAEVEQTQAARKQYAEKMTGKKWADVTNSELILVDELIAEKRRAGQGILEGEKPPAPKAEAVAPKAEPVSEPSGNPGKLPAPEAPAVVPKTEQAPMNWDLQRRKHLPAVQRAVESNVNTRVQADPKRYINAYQQSFGRANEYNADLAAELFREYRDNRTANRPAVASASSKIAYEALLDRLEKEPASASPDLALTAGGTGSGKSTVAGKMARPGTLSYDSTLAGPINGAIRLIEKALATGRNVEVGYVYREPVDAFQATLRRAREEGAGRVVDLDTHVGTHTNAPKNVTALMEKYSGDPRVTFNFSEMTPEGVKPGNAAILQKGAYNGLRERLADVLEQERKDGRISADIYHAIRGRDLQGEVPPQMVGSPGGGQLLRDAPGGDVPGSAPSRPPQAQSGHPTGSVDALTRAETAARERLNSAFKGETLSANPAALIGDVAIVGVAKLRRGVQKFSDWSREMVAELGERIKPYLAKAWVQARKLYRDERGTAPIIPGERLDPLPDPKGQGGKPKKTATAAAEAPGLVASTSLLKTKDNIVKRLSLSDETKQTIQAKIDEYAAKNPDLRPVGFEEIKAEARTLDPSLVADLNISKMKPGETLNPAVRFAAREALNAIQDTAQAKTKELREYANRESADPAKIMDMEREVGALEFESKRLLDVLLPTRSQDGRNLAYHRMMAEKSFDAEYWLHRAKRAAGIPPGREYSLPKPLADAINEATAEGRAAEQAATAKAKTLPEGRQKDAVENDPGVKSARRKLAKTLMVAEKTSLLDTITALRRAGLLTGVKTHLRNIGGNAAFQVMEEVSRIPAALVDGALATGTGRRTTFTADVRAVGKASYAAATRGVREARQVMRDGATAEQLAKLDVRKEINTGNKVIDTYVNTVFRSLGAEDRIFKTYAYERSLAERMKAEKVKEPTQAMILEALNDAAFATFNNPNSAAQFISRAKSAVGPGGRFVVDFLVPFQNTPANIVARVIEYSGGGAISSTVALARSRGVISKLDPAAQRQISMGVGRSMVGWALMYAGWKMAEKGLMTGASQEDPGQRELNRAAGRLNGAIKVGDTWQTISALAPGGNMLTIGASAWEAANNPKRVKKGAPSVAAGLVMVGTKTVMEQPMLKGMQDAIDALERPDSSMEFVAASAAGSFVPTIVADVTSVFDDKMREARGVTRGVANRLPGTRNQLPPRVDALGRDIPQNKTAAINPGIGSEAVENKNPVVREMIRLRAPLSGLRRREEEPDKPFTERQRLVGRAVATAVKGVMDSPTYQRLSDDERRDAVSMAAGRTKAKITTILGRANYDKLSEAERLRILANLKESLNR